MSARDKLRQANFGALDGGLPIVESKNVVTDILDDYEHKDTTKSQESIVREIDVVAKSINDPAPITVPKKVGRPIEHTEELKTVSVRLSKDNYDFIKRNGWEFGGYTGYINHLIEEKRAETYNVANIT